MHAVFVTVSIEPGTIEESRNRLKSEVVPRVSQAPGFVAGYWTDSTEGTAGRSCLIFDSESTAQRAVEMVKNTPRPEGVTLQSVEANEVIASA